MTGEMVGDEDHQQPVLRNVGFTGIAPINNDFFINLNRQLREASDESEVPRDGDGKFTYRVVGVPKIDRDTGNQVWTDEQPYYLEDENGKVIGEATQPDGEITGNFPYYKLLNTSNNTLIKLPQRMEKVLTDSFGIEHEEFEELIKGCVENSDDFADNIHRLQFRGDKNSWPKPSIRETSLAELLNIPEIRDSITGDNNNHQPKLVSIEQIEDFNETLTGLEFSTNYRKFYGKVLGNGLERQRKLQEIDEVLFKKVRNKVNDLKDLKKLVLGDTEEIKNDKEEFNGKEMIKRVELAELMKELLKKEREANPNNNHENDKQGNEQVSELEKAKFIAIQRIRQELTKDPEITEQELEEDKRR
ncbi:10743_t:CDS:2 [Funneliformis geosporum]|uniref:10743_t:CDS:1 n=1 Tax=Funneliformis geosporum TaxID=1117311 RepID=A0A9W4SBV3_9GLOM|nr:10743_t:CDS:2 [Funneliformis geosporum]